MKLKLILILLVLGFAAGAQAPERISPLPGDTIYKDASAPGDPVYLWYHAAGNSFEIVGGYSQDQVIRLLLGREQAAWTTLYWVNRTTFAAPAR